MLRPFPVLQRSTSTSAWRASP